MGKKSNMIKYVHPDIEIIYISVEYGFSVSYGDSGEAGNSFDIEDNGDF